MLSCKKKLVFGDSTPSVEEIFQSLSDFFAPLEALGVDVDDMPDSLVAMFPHGKKYLILFQRECQQLWVSSPISGGRHFEYHATQHLWKDTRTSQELGAFFQQEFCLLLGAPQPSVSSPSQQGCA